MLAGFRFLLPLLAVFAAAGPVRAQVTEYTRETGAFSRVEVSGAFEVELTGGSGYSVTVSVDEMLMNFVQAYVDGKVLKIYIDEKKLTPEIRRHYRSRNAADPVLRAEVSAPAAVRSLSLGGKARLGAVNGNVFAADSARFFLADDARMENVTLAGSEAVQLTLDRRSSADISAECGSFILVAGGGSRAQVRVESGEAEVSMSANSSCVYNGNTDRIKVSARGTSRSIFNGASASAEYQMAGSADVNAENFKVVDAKVVMSGFCSLTESATGSLFLDMSNGARLVYKNSPVFFISSIRNSSVARYYDDGTEGLE